MCLVTEDAADGHGDAQVLGEVKVEQSQLRCSFIWAEKRRRQTHSRLLQLRPWAAVLCWIIWSLIATLL